MTTYHRTPKSITSIGASCLALAALMILTACPGEKPPSGPGTSCFILVLPDPRSFAVGEGSEATFESCMKSAVQAFSQADFHVGDRILVWQLNRGRPEQLGDLRFDELDNAATLRNNISGRCKGLASKAPATGEDLGEGITLWEQLNSILTKIGHRDDFQNFYFLFGFPPPLMQVAEKGDGGAMVLPTPTMREFLEACLKNDLSGLKVRDHERDLLQAMRLHVCGIAETTVTKPCEIAFAYSAADPGFKRMLQEAEREAGRLGKELVDFSDQVCDGAMRDTWQTSLAALKCSVRCFGSVPKGKSPWGIAENKSPGSGYWNERSIEAGSHAYTGFPASLFRERRTALVPPLPAPQKPAPLPPPQPPSSRFIEEQSFVIRWSSPAEFELAAWVGGQRLDCYSPEADLGLGGSGRLQTRDNEVDVIIRNLSHDTVPRFFVRRYGAAGYAPAKYEWRFLRIAQKTSGTSHEEKGNGSIDSEPSEKRSSNIEFSNVVPSAEFGWREVNINP